jgi:hypothetical protein
MNIFLKSIYDKDQIQYLAEQFNFAKKNKLDIGQVYLWFEEEDSSFPGQIEVAFRTKYSKED